MRFTELQALMHAVLDGEATPAEAAELERQLAANPAARGEFDQLRRLFADLAGVPRKHPPEGLVAAVQAGLPATAQAGEQADQLSPASRVFAAPSGGIDVRRDGPTEQQHQPALPQRSLPMTQPHPPYSAKRKAWIGAGIALVAVAIVVRFGFDSVPKSEDVAGTVVAAQRYRAPQGTADIKLGDQTMAQLMQNDAFVKLIRDPQVQAMVREPGFAEAARIMMERPELARALALYAEPAKSALSDPETARAMKLNAGAAQKVQLAAVAAADLQASPEAMRLLKTNQDLSRYVQFMADLSKKALLTSADKAEAANLLVLNATQAQKFAEQASSADKVIRHQDIARIAADNVALDRFIKAHEEASRVAPDYAAAAALLARSPAVMQLVALNYDAARFFMLNADVAKVANQMPAALHTLMAYPNAAQAMLAAPAASRYLLQNVDAARVVAQAAAERRAD